MNRTSTLGARTLSRTAAVILAGTIGFSLAGGPAHVHAATADVERGADEASLMQNRNRATVLLRNGNRVSGEFEDIQNDLLYLRVSQDDERRIPLGRVVVIDFVGSANGFSDREANASASGDHVLVLRDSTIWRGRLQDVFRQGEGGSQTRANARIEVTFRRNNGRTERIRLRRVGRIYLGSVR